ncbi:MAG: phosphotransferase, partial [Nocardioidaceae bacterium]
VDGFDPAGPWRMPIADDADVLAHGDLAVYNAVFAGDRLVGMFDWDLACPSTRLRELAHLVWMTVPLYRRIAVPEAARRIRLVADAYGGITPEELLAAVPVRIRANIAVISKWVADGDPAGKAQAAIGEPEHTIAALAALEQRLPAIAQALEEDRR